MRIVNTHECEPEDLHNHDERESTYCGLDCCVTSEILEVLLPQLDDHTRRTYSFSRALQGPVLEMQLRGILVDQARRQEAIDLYTDKIDQLEQQLEQIVLDGVGMPTFSWRSNPDLQKLFFGYLGIPVIRKQGRPTTDHKALEKMQIFLVARPIVNHLPSEPELTPMDEFEPATISQEQILVALALATRNLAQAEIYRTWRKALEAFSSVIGDGSLPSSTPRQESLT